MADKLAAGQIQFQFEGQVITTTVAGARELVAKKRAENYTARRDANRAEAKAAGDAAFDAHVQAAFDQAAAEGRFLSVDEITAAEVTGAKLRGIATRARYIELGYGICAVEACEQLTSPLPNGGAYERCVQHVRSAR